jgi:hypothetical protein
MLSDVRVSIDEFRWIGEDLREGEKRVRGGDRGLFIASFNLQKGLGLEEIKRCRAQACRRRSPTMEEGDDKWGQCVSVGERL